MVQQVSGQLESYLRDYGWSFRKMDDNHWVTGFQGKDRSYPLRLLVSDTWITFQIHPFLKLNVDWECWPELAKFLLELNHSSQMVKLVLNEKGHIGLTLEALASGLNYEAFSDCLGILGYYADYLFDEVLTFMDHIGFNYSLSMNFLT